MLHLGLLALLASPLPRGLPEPAPPTPIYGGETVEPGAWPYAVAIVIRDYLCTGTLVSDRVVLTAAHCLDGAPPIGLMQVRLGDDVNFPNVAHYAVADYGSHPKFCGDTEKCKEDIYDYGYVILEEPVTEVAPVRVLTAQEEWDEVMRVGSPITVVGYGLDEKKLIGIKRQVEVDIVKFSGSGIEFQAGGDGMDSCQGDSGGPAFVRLSSGEWVLGGVTSRGFTCGDGGFYAVPYAGLCWLHEETGVDLRPDACEACDCLDTAPEKDKCGCAAGDDAGGALTSLALLAWGWSRRRRPR